MASVVEARRSFVRDQLAAAVEQADRRIAGRAAADADPVWRRGVVAEALSAVASEDVTLCLHLRDAAPGSLVHVGDSDPTALECMPCAARTRIERVRAGIAGCDGCGLDHVPNDATLVVTDGALRQMTWLCDDCAKEN